MAYGRAKVDNSGLNQLKLAIKQKYLRGAYLFYGEEAYLQERYLELVKEGVLDPGTEAFNYHLLEGKEVSPELIEQTMDCLPMMAKGTLVVVKDWDVMKAGEEQRSKILEILGQIPPYCTVVFYYQSLDFKALPSKYLTALKELLCLVQFPRQEQGILVDWIQRHFADLKQSISPPVALEMMFYCGDSMTVLAGEIEKVGAYAQGPQITKEDIVAVATPHLDAMVYAMADAMGAGNFDGALGVLYQLYQRKEPPLKIMDGIARLLRQLYGAKLAQMSGRNQSYVADLFGMRPYPAQKIMGSARRFSLEWCQKAVEESGKTDWRLKSSGKHEDKDQIMMLAELVLQLAGG